MGSITDVLLASTSVPELMIKIWEFSEHVHENPPPHLLTCDCKHYLDICIDYRYFLIWQYIDFNFVGVIFF